MNASELAFRREAIADLVRHGHLECARLELDYLIEGGYAPLPLLRGALDNMSEDNLFADGFRALEGD